MVRPKSELRKKLEDVAAAHEQTLQSAPSSDESRRRIAAELERLSIPGVLAVNQRDWDLSSEEFQEAKQHLSPDFKSHWDGMSTPLTFAENMAAIGQLAKQDPQYRQDIESVSSDVDEEKGVGVVYLQVRVSGNAGVEMKGLTVLNWRRDENGFWWCHQAHGMRGSDMDSVFI